MTGCVRRNGASVWPWERPGGMLICAAHLMVAITIGAASAQDSEGVSATIPSNPVDYQLRVPNAPPISGGDRRVILAESANRSRTVVGNVYLQVGDYFVVILPDGRIRSLPQRETTVTDRPFEPATHEELARRLVEVEFPGFKTRTTRRYVYCYNASDAFAKGAGRILETMYPGLVSFCKKYRLDVQEPEFPLVVIMFRTEREYREATRMKSNVAAFYNGISNYIFMYEQSDNAEAAPELALKQSISTIAHEGVHQILHNIGVQQRLSRWPMWISEGLPEYFAPTEVGKRVRWKGVGLVNDLRLHTLQTSFSPPSLPGRPIVEPTVTAKRLDALGYAQAWALTHYLASRQKKKFKSLLQTLSQLAPLAAPPAAGEIYTSLFGDDYASADRALKEHLASLPYVDPIVNQTHYVAMARRGTRRMTLVTASRQAIGKFQQETGAAVAVKSFPDRATAERFAARWRTGG